MATVTYSVSGDFPNGQVQQAVLIHEIISSPSIATTLQGVNVVNNDCNIFFASALSGPETTALSAIVAAHEGIYDDDADVNPDILTRNIDGRGATGVNISDVIINSGLVDGRDVSAEFDGTDSHIAASSGVHGVSGNVVGTSDSQTLSNKTISSSTNTIGANELRTTGASVTIDSSAPPSLGNILTATSATNATWQAPGFTPIPNFFVNETGAFSTTSATYVVVGPGAGTNTMTITPGAGTWYVIFNVTGEQSSLVETAELSIHTNGTLLPGSVRRAGASGTAVGGIDEVFSTDTITTVGAGQAIDARIRISGGATFTLNERSLSVVRLA